jgi:uncharacterized protein (TIGR02391 family)
MSVARFADSVVLGIARILGDTGLGYTGSEIGRLLAECQLPDPGPITKRERIYQALLKSQARDGSGRPVAVFLQAAMDPVRYAGDRSTFDGRRDELNVVLAFAGVTLREDGKLAAVRAAATLTEAEKRANRLRTELVRRGIAGDVLRFCRPELVDGNYFHAVFEATKSVAQKLRDRTGLTLDGQTLVEAALSIQGGRKTPMLAWNTLTTTTEISEHRGIALMLSGVFCYFRNLPAHVPKVEAPVVSEEQALEVLTILSFLPRKLDAAVPTTAPPARR